MTKFFSIVERNFALWPKKNNGVTEGA